MIDIKNVTVVINKNHILADINVSFNDGEIVGIIGKSGAGKTTLLKTISGGLKKYSGSIIVNGTSSRSWGKKFVRTISYYGNNIPQNLDETLDNFLLLSRLQYKKFFRPFSDYDRLITEEYRHILDLDAYADWPLNTLPDNIFKRALLANIFIRETYAIVLDNPTNDLDIVSLKLLNKAMSHYALNGTRVVVFCSNDLNFISQTADRILIMDEGHIVESGTADMLNSDLIKRYYGIDVVVSRSVYNGRPEIHFFPEA